MTDNSNPLETMMNTAILDGEELVPLSVSTDRSSAALRFLMRYWERDGVVDEGESETELMVLLSGMVNVSDPTLGEP